MKYALSKCIIRNKTNKEHVFYVVSSVVLKFKNKKNHYLLIEH